jgi:hypothetical protein
MLLLHTGRHVDELVTRTCQRVNLQVRSEWIDVGGVAMSRQRSQGGSDQRVWSDGGEVDGRRMRSFFRVARPFFRSAYPLSPELTTLRMK